MSTLLTRAWPKIFGISGLQISPSERQLNAKVCSSESAIFSFLLAKTTIFNDDISKNGSSILTVILARN